MSFILLYSYLSIRLFHFIINQIKNWTNKTKQNKKIMIIWELRKYFSLFIIIIIIHFCLFVCLFVYSFDSNVNNNNNNNKIMMNNNIDRFKWKLYVIHGDKTTTTTTNLNLNNENLSLNYYYCCSVYSISNEQTNKQTKNLYEFANRESS